MQTKFLYHLLGLYLLLTQLLGQVPGCYLDETIQVCGREYVRLHIEVCGKSYLRESIRKRCRRSPGINGPKTLPIANHLEVFNGMLQSGHDLPEKLTPLPEDLPLQMNSLQPALKNANLNSPKFKRIFNKNINMTKITKYRYFSELNNLVIKKHSHKKRELPTRMASKCCWRGCTRRELANIC